MWASCNTFFARHLVVYAGSFVREGGVSSRSENNARKAGSGINKKKIVVEFTLDSLDLPSQCVLELPLVPEVLVEVFDQNINPIDGE